MKQRNINKIGRPAAVLAAVFALTYSLFAILSLLNLIPHPYELFWQFLPSLLLAFAFVITVVCLHYIVAEENKIYTAIGSAFAIIYCTCASIVYFIQLAVVVPQLLQHKIDDNHLLAFADKSFMVAIDCIGYGVMSLSTFFSAFAFKDAKSRWLYRSLLFSGILIPFVVGSFFIPALMAVGALWMIAMPMAMINAAAWFGNSNKQISDHNSLNDQNLESKELVRYEYQ